LGTPLIADKLNGKELVCHEYHVGKGRTKSGSFSAIIDESIKVKGLRHIRYTTVLLKMEKTVKYGAQLEI
jgi:hypothetical protein